MHPAHPWNAIQEWRAEYGGVELDDEEIDGWRDRALPKLSDFKVFPDVPIENWF